MEKSGRPRYALPRSGLREPECGCAFRLNSTWESSRISFEKEIGQFRSTAEWAEIVGQRPDHPGVEDQKLDLGQSHVRARTETHARVPT